MVFWPDFIRNTYVCRKCSLLFGIIFFYELYFYLMSCFLNFDNCINAVEKMPVRPSVIEKSHKPKIRIDFKVFFSLLHIWEERHQKNDHISAYILCHIVVPRQLWYTCMWIIIEKIINYTLSVIGSLWYSENSS